MINYSPCIHDPTKLIFKGCSDSYVKTTHQIKAPEVGLPGLKESTIQESLNVLAVYRGRVIYEGADFKTAVEMINQQDKKENPDPSSLEIDYYLKSRLVSTLNEIHDIDPQFSLNLISQTINGAKIPASKKLQEKHKTLQVGETNSGGYYVSVLSLLNAMFKRNKKGLFPLRLEFDSETGVPLRWGLNER